MPATSHFPNLEQFLSSYFHEDWMHDAADLDGVLGIFADEATDETWTNVLAEISRFRMLRLQEPEYAQLLMRLGSRYYYSEFGLTAPEWLTQLYDRLTQIRTTEPHP